MPLISVSGIVTRYVNYRESDRILSILTPDRGRVDAKSRGCLRTTSPLMPASQPFVFGRYELYGAKDKYTVNSCDIQETFYPLREDYARFAAGSAALQLAHDAAQENLPNEALFSLLYHTLSFLSYGNADPVDLMLCFLLRFLNVCGYRPSITACACCGRDVRQDAQLRFSVRAGGTVCAACGAGGGEAISVTALEAMRRMLFLEDSEMDRVRLTEPLRREIQPKLNEYLVFNMDFGAKAVFQLAQLQALPT